MRRAPRRQLVDHRHRLVLQRIRAAADRAHRQAERQRRADPSRDPDPLHRVDDRIERVEQQQPERQRREQRLHVLQQENRDAERDDEQRDCSRRRVPSNGDASARFGCRRRQAWISAICAAKSYRFRHGAGRIAIHVPWNSVCTCAARMATQPDRTTCFRAGAARCACRDTSAARAPPLAGGPASASERAPADRRADGRGRKSGRSCSRGGSGPLSPSSRSIYDNWGWAIGTGLMAAFAFLAWPREVPPRVGLEHEFCVDDDEFLTTIAGSTGIPFFEGNAHRDSQQRRRVLSRDAEGDRAGASAL